jgi:hypothetical protein
VAFNSRVTDNVLRVGVNYKFDPNEIWADYRSDRRLAVD